ncbi:transposase [Turneriella parva]|uniref:Transposase IS200-like domain-containing protein n=1 Tax=Turneriella parva (strain ATCC BAA-1111 / DSM 21527 / NCTC 11395 / H) TaxID=869212 RepID=I4B1M4_TURPD|nr:transposase [Turneriella parva]AFM11181.1 hypothetical protein Turpa_0527 [Turneriella parva DSM 21527]
MALFKHTFRVESTRLPGYDYAKPGAYFVTICARGRRSWFGEIRNGIMALNEAGNLVWREWHRTGQLVQNLKVDEFIVMPNHVHGILIIGESIDANTFGIQSIADRKTVETPFTGVSLNSRQKMKETPGKGVSTDRANANISIITNQFKRACTLGIRRNFAPDFSWQTRFYEHIIRDDASLTAIRQYIQQNPVNWTKDEYYGS